MKSETIQVSEGEYILCDAAIAESAQARWFDAQYWRDANQVVAEAPGRGSSLIVRHGEQQWVLRQYRRGGLRARFGELDYFWSGLEATRPWREWHLLAAMFAQGLPVPKPVAAHVRQQGLFYRAAIITAYIEDSRPLSAALQEAPLSEQLWCRLGMCLYRFHHADIYHADLNAHNILIRDEGFYLIDFDRGERRSGQRWRARTLKRLRRSLDKLQGQHEHFHFSEHNWQCLLDGYQRGSLLFGNECG